MTDSEKLDLLLNKVIGLEEKMDRMDSRMGNMESKMEIMDSRIGSLETKVEGMDSRIGSLETKVEGMDSKIEKLQNDVKSIKLTIENEIRVNIQRVAEGHLDLARNLHEAMKSNSEVEMLAIRVGKLETDVRDLKIKMA